ncbi:MAG TPA: 5-carboxymethyl-2-hydroxymuconate isomerase [Planctomycetaceae bacterium]|nr:5-carboxymethyl-2-hydroxymuconate isomerase [Planctomycetaceae bacterium]
MRLCRIQREEQAEVAFYDDDQVVPLRDAQAAYTQSTGESLDIASDDNLLRHLPPAGDQSDPTQRLADWLATSGAAQSETLGIPTSAVQLLVPNPTPPKLFLLAGNYAKHIEEGGEIAAERAETFPYVFMKPPTTTLTHPGSPVRIPAVSPHHIDWELELGVIIGRGGKSIREEDALHHVAGYTVINDISNRKFRPNPDRKERPKDAFFDWLHGKWHDSACPCGPCITSANAIPDPQALEMQLRVNGTLHQDASTAQQIFPVAAVIAFISSFVTLEPGDMISTGTAAGVGNTTATYLQPGDQMEASIESIGTLVSPVQAESD